MSETAEVVWVFRPDDPKRQGKRETIPADMARLKVAEGLAKWPETSKSEPAEGDADEKAPRKAKADADSGKQH